MCLRGLVDRLHDKNPGNTIKEHKQHSYSLELVKTVKQYDLMSI